MTKFCLLLFLSLSAFAQKKPITLETLNQGGRGGGRGGAGFGAAAQTWAPDGKTFVFRQGRALTVYDPATRTSKQWIDTSAIDAAAMAPPAADGPTDWTNRRARVGGMQFSNDGKTLLYVASGDLFLIHTDTGKWDQLT
ncbi:MAG TPA: hypothetical protein VGF59_12465, partial [Bryobacteraceae bacterium]